METIAIPRMELLQVADAVAREKGIDRDDVLTAMEQAIQKAGRSKYGHEHDIRAQIDRKTNTLIQIHNTNPCSTAIGVSIDAEKFVWLVDQEGWAWKIDPLNVPAMKKVDIIGDHYTYSDMTGAGLNLVVNPPTG